MPRIVASGTALMYLIPVAGKLYVPPTEVGGMVDDFAIGGAAGCPTKADPPPEDIPKSLEAIPPSPSKSRRLREYHRPRDGAYANHRPRDGAGAELRANHR